MPMDTYLANVIQAGTSSRKRSFADITRSESRSTSPEISSKRRRTGPTSSRGSYTTSATRELVYPRSQRDGFDYRRPVMSESPINPTQNTIDLTGEDDSLSPATFGSQPTSRSSSRISVLSQPSSTGVGRYDRASHFNEGGGGSVEGNTDFTALEVIDLVDDDGGQNNQIRSNRDHRPTLRTSSSSEVEFVQERPVQEVSTNQDRRGLRRPPARLRITSPPPPPPPPPQIHTGAMIASIPDLIRRSTQLLFRNGNHHPRPADHAFDEFVMDRIDGLGDRVAMGPPRGGNGQMLGYGGDDFEVITLDYQQRGFALGGNLEIIDRSSETPQTVQEAYKGPPAAQEGFTRNYGEEDILICPMCGDELASGSGDVKQQVWVVKQCGHVYCGQCAMSRNSSKAGNKKDNKRNASKKTITFKKCIVQGCDKSVTAKTAMFPIYL